MKPYRARRLVALTVSRPLTVFPYDGEQGSRSFLGELDGSDLRATVGICA